MLSFLQLAFFRSSRFLALLFCFGYSCCFNFGVSTSGRFYFVGIWTYGRLDGSLEVFYEGWSGGCSLGLEFRENRVPV